MKKNILIYVAGVFTGLVLWVIFAILYSGCTRDDKDIILFEAEGECISSNSFEIFQVLESGNALAREIEEGHSIATGITVLFLNDGTTSYYDNQIINIPKGKCAKQIGVYRYMTRMEVERTVPIVEIRDE
ncbi:MAG: hypothetical protein NC043_05010 [Muribaculaceae bacterium]|nr:hypothetical protein [Muribaculaceae bacterium]